jgi:antitoxin StbD
MRRRQRAESVRPGQPRIEVVTVREAKGKLSTYLAEARKLGVDAPPRVFGAQRRPEAVVLSFDSWLDLMDAAEDQEIAALVAARAASRGTASATLDEAMEALGVDPNEHSLD